MTATPYPLEGVVSWNMNTTCNYRCSYCTQRFKDNRKQWARDLPGVIEAFTGLPGDWEIKLSGGEPLRHPDFSQTVAALAKGGMRVSVVTNLSASRDTLARFAADTTERPGLLSASLHLEYAEPEAFLEMLKWLEPQYAGRMCVTVVDTRNNLPRLPALAALFESAGIPFKIQPEKQDREVIAYTAEEQASVLAMGGHNHTGRIAPDFFGRLCWAGARYFIVDHLGEAWRYYPARRYRQEYLGNILRPGFSLPFEPRPCPYRYCNCTVPQQRGMMPTN